MQYFNMLFEDNKRRGIDNLPDEYIWYGVWSSKYPHILNHLYISSHGASGGVHQDLTHEKHGLYYARGSMSNMITLPKTCEVVTI